MNFGDYNELLKDTINALRRKLCDADIEIEFRFGQLHVDESGASKYVSGYCLENIAHIKAMVASLSKVQRLKCHEFCYLKFQFEDNPFYRLVTSSVTRDLCETPISMVKTPLCAHQYNVQNRHTLIRLCISSEKSVAVQNHSKPKTVTLMQRKTFVEVVSVAQGSMTLEISISKVSVKAKNVVECAARPCVYQVELEIKDIRVLEGDEQLQLACLLKMSKIVMKRVEYLLGTSSSRAYFYKDQTFTFNNVCQE